MNIENPRPHPSCVYYSLKPLPYQFSQRFGGEHPKKKLGLPSLAKCPVEKARTSLTNHAKRGMRSGLSEKKAIPNELMVEPNLPRHSMANHQGFFRQLARQSPYDIVGYIVSHYIPMMVALSSSYFQFIP